MQSYIAISFEIVILLTMNILNFDNNLLVSINHALIGHYSILDSILEAIASYTVYVLPVLLLALWFIAPKKREALFLAFFAAFLAWLIITKLIVPSIWLRARPDLALLGVKEVIFHRPSYSFPSDHATLLFGLSFGLFAFDWKKAGWWFLAFAIVVSLARVAVGVHFPLDILGGIASAAIGVWIVNLLKKPILAYIYKPIVWVLKKIKLA